MPAKHTQRLAIRESSKIRDYVVLDSQLWFTIESHRGEIPRDEFIVKILSHGLGSSYNGFGVES